MKVQKFGIAIADWKDMHGLAEEIQKVLKAQFGLHLQLWGGGDDNWYVTIADQKIMSPKTATRLANKYLLGGDPEEDDPGVRLYQEWTRRE